LSGGPDAEFTALVERQSRFVFRVAYAVLRNSHDAEDAVQETFLKLFRNGGWHDLRNERAFLARVTWRIAVDRSVARPLPTPETSDAAENELPSREAGPEQALLDARWEGLVHGLIDALPEELRQPLALSGIDELNSREIGEILGVPEGTVRTRIKRARDLMRQKLAAMEAPRYARQ
jgi:RNA polymerase sigma-70 factor, ECF subfamily